MKDVILFKFEGLLKPSFIVLAIGGLIVIGFLSTSVYIMVQTE
jgi:hypothetical protein